MDDAQAGLHPFMPTTSTAEFSADTLRRFLQPDETAADLLAFCYAPPLRSSALRLSGLRHFPASIFSPSGRTRHARVLCFCQVSTGEPLRICQDAGISVLDQTNSCRRNSVLQISGPTSAGKTFFCVQAAVTAILPPEWAGHALGGWGGMCPHKLSV